MRFGPVLLALLLAACSDDSLTRNFSLSRDATAGTLSATQVPLSVPPNMAERDVRPSVLGTSPGQAQAGAQPAGSAGEDAIVDAAGPAADADIRAKIDENSGVVYPSEGFVDRLMSWAPQPGYAPLVKQAKGSWFSGWF